MRKLTTILMLAVLSLPAFAVLPINPTTTLANETGNNTSAADSFTAQTNGNAGAGNISKMPISSLLYPGATTKIYVHWMPWFGPSNHMNVGYDSSDAAQVKRQVEDMISRGIDGAIPDWYGPLSTHHNTATLHLMHEAEAHPGFEFAITEDVGAVKNASNPQQKLIDDLNYVNSTFSPSPAYMRRDGRPVIFFFGLEAITSIDWNVVRASVSGNPLFIFRNSGAFNKVQTNGGFAWLQTQTTLTANYMSLGYLDNYYSTALKYPQHQSFGSGFKGFDDSLAAWRQNRKILQFCGQTWLASMAEAGKFYNSSNQLENLQLVTWNDYEEATELETGVDNCFSIIASLQGAVLQWSISGSESTIDHYTAFISLDGQNLMRLIDLAPGAFTLDVSSFNLGPGKYSLYVKAVGKASILNHMSNPVSYAIANQPPFAKLTVSPTSGFSPLTVAASTAGSNDPDGSISSTVIDFGDGTLVSVAPAGSASHVYNTPGNYTVSASVTDNFGASAITTATVAVKAMIARAVAISSPANNATVSSPVKIVASATTPNAFYTLQVYVDGAKIYQQSSATLNSSFNLATGLRSITVKGWDSGGSFMTNIKVTVNQPPIAKLALSPISGVSPVTVAASTAGSSDADGSIVSTVVAFGDGSIASVALGGSTSHLYSSPGTYNVSSTVIDNNGAQAMVTKAVTVLAPYVSISAPLNGSTVGSPVRVIAAAVSGNPIVAMKIYVDGVEAYRIAAPKIDTYLKMAAGTRRINVQAWENTGKVLKASVTVTVK